MDLQERDDITEYNPETLHYFIQLTNMDPAIPFGLHAYFEPFNISIDSEVAISWIINNGLNFHTGLCIWISSMRVFRVASLYVVMDENILPNLKLLGELDPYPL